jgi:hypothetical protein
MASSLTTSVLGIISELPANRQGHRTDTHCICCNAKFGKLGIAHARKFRWYVLSSKFCYRGVCRKCSNNKITHPERMIPTRVC